MEPTPVARRIAPALANALKTLEQSLSIDQPFDPSTSTREFHLMIPEAVEARVWHPLLQTTLAAAPNVTFCMHPVSTPDFRELVLTRKVDIGIYIRSFNGETMRSTFLFELPVSIVARKDHPIYGRKQSFTIDDFFKAGFVVLDDDLRRSIQLNQEILAMGRQRRIVARGARIWSVLHTAAVSDLVAVMPTHMARQYASQLGLRVFDLPIELAKDSCYMGWHQEYTDDPAHRWLRETIREVVSEPDRAEALALS